MKYCESCGAENEPIAKFCRVCGAKLGERSQENQVPEEPFEMQPEMITAGDITTSEGPSGRKSDKKTIWIGAGAMGVVLVVLLAFMLGKSSASRDIVSASEPSHENVMKESIPSPVQVPCITPTATLLPTPDAYVAFQDPVFEDLIRQRLNKPYGGITQEELDGIESLAIIGDFAREEYYSYYFSGDEENRQYGSFTYEDGLRYPRGRLSDISDIVRLRNLTHLYISCTEISNIEPLAGMTQLEELRLSSNIFLSDIYPLAGLVNLKGELSLWRNNISDLRPLVNLHGIDQLTLSSNNISDITPLAGLINLTSINLYHNQISDITPLGSLEQLTYLQLNSNRVQNLEPLIRIPGLEELRIQNNNVSDISVLYYLRNLKYVNLRGNPIVDYRPVLHVPQVDR